MKFTMGDLRKGSIEDLPWEDRELMYLVGEPSEIYLCDCTMEYDPKELPASELAAFAQNALKEQDYKKAGRLIGELKRRGHKVIMDSAK